MKVSLRTSGAYVIDAPEQWSQRRTLYGGMTAALSLEALKRAQPDVGPLRSAQFAFIGPASGRLRLRPELLRKGRSATIVGVDCVGEAGLAARSIFTFGAQRESQIAHDFAWRLDVPPPEACEPFHKGKTRGFVANFELRRASGGNLFAVSLPIGAINDLSGHVNKVDLLYVCAIARHRGAGPEQGEQAEDELAHGLAVFRRWVGAR